MTCPFSPPFAAFPGELRSLAMHACCRVAFSVPRPSDLMSSRGDRSPDSPREPQLGQHLLRLSGVVSLPSSALRAGRSGQWAEHLDRGRKGQRRPQSVGPVPPRLPERCVTTRGRRAAGTCGRRCPRWLSRARCSGVHQRQASARRSDAAEVSSPLMETPSLRRGPAARSSRTQESIKKADWPLGFGDW